MILHGNRKVIHLMVHPLIIITMHFMVRSIIIIQKEHSINLEEIIKEIHIEDIMQNKVGKIHLIGEKLWNKCINNNKIDMGFMGKLWERNSLMKI